MFLGNSHIHLPELFLASSSPRRIQFLKELGINFVALTPQFDEITVPGERPEWGVLENARGKAEIVFKQQTPEKPRLVIGADTIVAFEGTIFGKPKDYQDALHMLSSLNGNWHRVISGVCLLEGQDATCLNRREFSVETKVEFKKLSLAEIKHYLTSSQEAFDKAGGYAIQGLANYFVKQIVGSYSNVVGLPMSELIDSLIELRTDAHA